ncbi:unnamed protein product [Rotaria magnacalcarata]|uniref:Uncharacterized protein n=2 Tax=Rotaria magnacalcarata TaxID=392030 RepID=A0A816M2H1_9BILA|nr:unnamed protein product [Rotaria magnacalcarata]
MIQDFTGEDAHDKEHWHVESEQYESTAKAQVDSRVVISRTDKKANESTHTPAHNLEKTCWSKHRSAIAVGAFCVFTIIMMISGILTVCFTAPTVTGILFCNRCF